MNFRAELISCFSLQLLIVKANSQMLIVNRHLMRDRHRALEEEEEE